MSKPPSFLSKLAKKIHPPLLTTPRESEQLLRSLQKSFRDQLDQEHPLPRNPSRGPIDSHLNAVVTSPLFNRNTNPVTIRQESLVAPHEYFKHEVATGNATLTTAKECIRTCIKHRQTFENSSGFAERNLLIQSVRQWLWSSGMEESMEFVHDETFVNLLLDNMTPESRLFYATKWYKRLSTMTLEKLHTPQELRDEFAKPMALLFGKIVHHNGSRADNSTQLKSTMRDFIALAKTVSKDLPRKTRLALFNTALNPLANSILQTSLAKEIEIAFYDNFLSAIKKIPCGSQWVLAVLDLKHPSKPSATKSLSYFDTLSLEKIKEMEPAKRGRTLALADQTVDFLLASNQIKEAQSLLDRFQVPSPNEGSRGTDVRGSLFQSMHLASGV